MTDTPTLDPPLDPRFDALVAEVAAMRHGIDRIAGALLMERARPACTDDAARAAAGTPQFDRATGRGPAGTSGRHPGPAPRPADLAVAPGSVVAPFPGHEHTPIPPWGPAAASAPATWPAHGPTAVPPLPGVDPVAAMTRRTGRASSTPSPQPRPVPTPATPGQQGPSGQDRAAEGAVPETPTQPAPVGGAHSALTAVAGQVSPKPSFFTPARLLALGGALVTIMGVGFLLAVAIATGLFGAVPRVVSLMVLSIATGIAGTRLRRCSTEAGIALASTSSVSAFGVVVATTSIYEWAPPFVGLVLALLVGAAGYAVADRWRSEIMAGLVFLQVLVVVPIIFHTAPFGFSPLLFVGVGSAPALALAFRHRWPVLARVASAGLLLFTGLGALRAASGPDLPAVVTALVVAVLVSVVAVRTEEFEVLLGGVAVASLAVAVVALHDPHVLGLPVSAILSTLVAATAVVGTRAARGRLRPVLGVAAAAHLGYATLAFFAPARMDTLAFAVEALILTVLARRLGGRMAWYGAWMFTGVALVRVMLAVTPALVAGVPWMISRPGVVSVLASLVLAGVGVLDTRAEGAPLRRDRHALAGAALTVYGVSSAIVATAWLPFIPPSGQMVGNVLVTLVWVGAATVLILRGSGTLQRAGYVLVAVSVGKLFLLDLMTVGGILRAVLFVLTGLALIGVASQIKRGDGPQDGTPTCEMQPVAAPGTGSTRHGDREGPGEPSVWATSSNDPGKGEAGTADGVRGGRTP